jgi:hypothetical protein
MGGGLASFVCRSGILSFAGPWSIGRISINNPLRLLGLRIRLSELLFYDIGKEPGG